MKTRANSILILFCFTFFSCAAHQNQLPKTKEISSINEMNNLMVEMPEIVSLKEGLPAYYVHVYTPDMPVWDNKIEAHELLTELRKKIDPNVQINSRPYARSIKYTVYYGPYPSKLEVARMAKKIKNWDRTLSWKPEAIHYPASEEEVAELIRHAGEENRRIKPVGSALSWSDVFDIPQVAMRFDKMADVIDVDKDEKLIRERPGL